MKLDENTFKLTEKGPLGTICLILGVLGIAASTYGYFVDQGQLFHSYLVAFLFWLSIGLGGLFFTLIHYMANAKWSVVLRRFSESVAMGLPMMALFFIPIIALGMHDLFHWTDVEAVAHDALLQEKSAFLNFGFFSVRAVVYFVVWSFLAWYLYSRSVKQDSGVSEGWLKNIYRVSAPGLILFALTITFASFDWMMSLDPHWYSTIFGVYYFAGSFLAFLCFAVVVNAYVGSKGVLKGIVHSEHYHDLGKLILAFIIFWAYMGFSQYFLIWYANIPEETIWFIHRWEGSWKTVSLTLIYGHFALPFIVLLLQGIKRNAFLLSIVAIWILIMRIVDIYWLIFPSYSHHGVHLSWMDLSTLVGIGGFFVWFVWNRYTANALIPIKDPHLGTSVRHSS